jgi:hypothetical protein
LLRAFFGGAAPGTAQAVTRDMAVRSAAEGQREPLVPAMATLPERRARLAAEASVVRAASRAAAALPLREVRRGPPRTEVHRAMPAEAARETAAARLGDKLREQVAARAPAPQEVTVVRGAPEAKEPEELWAPAGKLEAQGREAEASPEPVA